MSALQRAGATSSAKLLYHCLSQRRNKCVGMRAGRVGNRTAPNHRIYSQRDLAFGRRKLARKNFLKKTCSEIVLYLTISLYETQRAIEAGPLALGKRPVWSTE